mgnify:CR=1 FL=1
MNNALRDKSIDGSNSSSDKNSEMSAVGNTIIGARKKNKLLEYNETGAIINLGVKQGKVKGVFTSTVLAGPQSLGPRDYLDKTEMKRRDGEIKKLQDQVKQQIDLE